MKSLKLALVGSGTRVKSIYLPVFRSINIAVEISGFTTRSKEKGELFSQETDIRFFDSAKAMILEIDPDYVLVAVSMGLNNLVVEDLLAFGKPIIVETPLAWTKKQAKQLVDKANKMGVKLYVMEQFPYLPDQLLKRQLFNDNIFGKIYAVHNDFSAYRYHGIARARQYLDGQPKRLQSKKIKFDANLAQDGGQPIWQMSEIEFSNGSRLFHTFSYEYFQSKICHPAEFRIYGEKASMVDDSLKVFVDSHSEVFTASILRETTEKGATKRLSISVPHTKDYVWENPYAKDHLSDEQTAVANLLTSILTNGANDIKPYTGSQFVIDIEIDQAIACSVARSGGNVNFPLKESRQKIMKFLNFEFWKNKITGG